MSDFLFDALHQGLGNVLDLRLQQNGLTVSNLANADTPGYEARFIPFDEVLSAALEAGPQTQLDRSRPEHFGAPGVQGASPTVEKHEGAPWVRDGNSVLPEREMAALHSNQLMYTAVANGLSRRLAILRYAASDGKG